MDFKNEKKLYVCLLFLLILPALAHSKPNLMTENEQLSYAFGHATVSVASRAIKLKSLDISFIKEGVMDSKLNQPPKLSEEEMKSLIKSFEEKKPKDLSYAIGYTAHKSIKNDKITRQFKELNTDAFAIAIKDSFTSAPLKISQPDIFKLLAAYNKKIKDASQNQIEAVAKEHKETNRVFLLENSKKKGIVTTESGLQYQVLAAGNGAKPALTDQVKVHYEGKLLSGKVFDSSYQRGEPVTFGLNKVFLGLREGLQLMSVGSKWKIFIPSDLAYGQNGNGGTIGPNETLIFEVELLDINPEA